MIFAGKTDRGKVRKTNQDDFAAGKLPQNAAYAVVCDGMGGANGGNIASSTAVGIISEAIKEGYSPGMNPEEIRGLLSVSIRKANTSVYEMSRKELSLYGMGTTVVACIAARGLIHVAHAGDSRAYLIKDDIIKLTRDHSIVQDMIENGKITPEEALTHPQKNIITRALGVEESLDIDFGVFDFDTDAAVLLCSDGLTNLVDDNAIQSIVKGAAPEEITEKLVTMANQNGGNDNITVVVICNALTGSEI